MLATLSCAASKDPTYDVHCAVKIQSTEGLSHFGHSRHYGIFLQDNSIPHSSCQKKDYVLAALLVKGKGTQVV